jgi:hypothetical protein
MVRTINVRIGRVLSARIFYNVPDATENCHDERANNNFTKEAAVIFLCAGIILHVIGEICDEILRVA